MVQIITHFNLDMDTCGREWTRHWKDVDWPIFSNLMGEGWDIPDTMTPKKLDKQVKYLYTRIDTALNLAAPLRPESRAVKSNVWFTDEHLQSV